MAAYYNENDPFAAEWLRNLIKQGHIADGIVDDRSILDVGADDVRGFAQCHFFAGIGGWSYALRLAGWPDDRPVWTGSCPCQPFSAAGKRRGAADARHLWPVWYGLIRQSQPATVFGEQVAAAIKLGWLDLVFADLEGEGYACGAAVLPACGVGSPHIRQRLWFVADAERTERRQVDNAYRRNRNDALSQRQESAGWTGGGQQDGVLADRDDERLGAGNTRRRRREPTNASPWRDLQWLPCTDGKARPTQPGIFPLAHGVSARVGKLRAAGNAIVPQAAAEFIKSYLDTLS